ncbi:MAG: hypothetical protein HY909_26145 [Deltaproteobacteria bacterium]|nr:hypothetical protein [Deltaproteobacteria bacterium]
MALLGALVLAVAGHRAYALLQGQGRYLGGPQRWGIEPDGAALQATLSQDPALGALAEALRAPGGPVVVAIHAGAPDALWVAVVLAFVEALRARGASITLAWWRRGLDHCAEDRQLRRTVDLGALASENAALVVVGGARRLVSESVALYARFARRCWLDADPLDVARAAREAGAQGVVVQPFSVEGWRVLFDPAAPATREETAPLASGVSSRPWHELAPVALEAYLGPEAFRALALGAVAWTPSPWASISLALELKAPLSLGALLKLVSLPLWGRSRWDVTLRGRLLQVVSGDFDRTLGAWTRVLVGAEPQDRASLAWLRWNLETLDQSLASGLAFSREALRVLSASPLARQVEAMVPFHPELLPRALRSQRLDLRWWQAIPGALFGLSLEAIAVGVLLGAEPWQSALAAAPRCLADFDDCDQDPRNGCETHLRSDPHACGRCGHHCAEGVVCLQGRCASPTIDAPDAGVDASVDAADAPPDRSPQDGSTAFPEEGTCVAPRRMCGRRCVDPRSNTSHCGRCGNSCASAAHQDARCERGVCIRTCRDGWGNCDENNANGCEASLATPTHCGRCGNACREGWRCQQGVCQPFFRLRISFSGVCRPPLPTAPLLPRHSFALGCQNRREHTITVNSRVDAYEIPCGTDTATIRYLGPVGDCGLTCPNHTGRSIRTVGRVRTGALVQCTLEIWPH